MARDLYEAARNYVHRTTSPAMELEFARNVVANFSLINVRMQQGGC